MAYAHKAYARVAMKVAEDKAKHPERYCAMKCCLYRLPNGYDLTTCPNHSPVKGDR